MKYLDEYRDGAIAGKIADEIRRTVTRPWVLMEVCGGQTHSIVKYGLDALARGGGAPRARLQGISEESGVPLVARHDVMPPPERQASRMPRVIWCGLACRSATLALYSSCSSLCSGYPG